MLHDIVHFVVVVRGLVHIKNDHKVIGLCLCVSMCKYAQWGLGHYW